METVFSGLKMVAAAVLFCLGIGCCILGDRTANRDMKHLEQSLVKKNDAIVYEMYENGKERIPYSEIISLLMRRLEHDIKVEDQEFNMEEYEPQEFDFSLIKKGIYQKKYLFHTDGTIEKIIYIKVGD